MKPSARPGPPWQRVLLAPWQQRANQGSMWFWYALAIALCAGAAGLSLLPKVPTRWAVATLLATLAFAGWIWLVNGLLVQNQPQAARLVPGHVRVLRRVLLGVGLAIALVAGLIGWALGHALAAMAGAALAMIAIAWIVRLPILGFFAWILPATNARWSHSAPWVAAVDTVTAAYRAQPGLVAWVSTMLLLAVSTVSVRALLQEGGPAHRRNYRQRMRVRTLLQTGQTDPLRGAATGRFGGGLRALSTALYQRVLARASTARSGTVLARGLVGLGPQFHWSGLLGTALTYGVLMLAVFWFVWGLALSGPHALKSQQGAIWPIAFGVLSVVVASGLAARGVFYTTRREQALLMLLPGMPRGAALNRQLAWRLLAQFGVTWAFGLVCCAALLPLDSHKFGWVLTLASIFMPMSALLWRDWSTLRAPTPLTPTSPLLVAMLIAGGIVALQLYRGLPVWPVVLGGGVVTLALLAWRWRVVVAAPTAFPAGRRS